MPHLYDGNIFDTICVVKFELQQYVTADGRVPFEEWTNSLDAVTAARVTRRLMRVENGNFGDCKSVKGGVNELRMAFGPGYRAYYGLDGRTLVLLLIGGDKKTQRADIAKAKTYWADYLTRKKGS